MCRHSRAVSALSPKFWQKQVPMADEPLTHLLQLPWDVLLDILEQCGPRAKWALFVTCHSGRRCILEAVQQISGSLQMSQLPKKRRPPLLMRGLDGCWLESATLQLKDVSLSSLLQCGGQLRGIKHLKLAMCKAANSKVSNFECCVQSQWWASSSAHRLQTALSQLRSLSINERAPSLHNVPGLLGTLAASCTQLTHMELSPRPLYPSSKDHIRGLLRALGQLSSVDAFPALQCLSIPDAEASEELKLLLSQPVPQRRVTRLIVVSCPKAFPIRTAACLRHLSELHLELRVSVREVQALQRFVCLSSLTVMRLFAKEEDPVLLPADLPPRLQVLRTGGLSLYSLCSFRKWLPALIAIPRLEVGYVYTHDGTGLFRESQLSASRDAAAALMHGRRLAGVELGLRSCRRSQQDGLSPVYLDCFAFSLNGRQELAFEAVQPLLSQLPFIDLLSKTHS